MEDLDPDDEFEYVIILARTTGEMRFKYAMIDKENNTLAPLLNKVVWPRLFDVVDFRACVLKNVLYVVGGRELSTGKYLKQVLKYDPDLSRWRECASMKKPRARHTVCALNGKLYVMGGCSSIHGQPIDTVETYEPILDEWKAMEEKMPGARKDHACISYDNKVILCGGISPTKNASDNIWQFKRLMPDPHKLEFLYVWEEKPDDVPDLLNNSVSNHMAVHVFQRLYVLGGVCHGLTYDGLTFIPEVEASKISQADYQSEKPPRALLATSKKMESYKLNQPPPVLDPVPENEPKKKERGRKRKDHKSQLDEKKIQEEAEAFTRKVLRKPWGRTRADLPEPRCCAGTVVIGHKLFVVGGYMAEDEQRRSCNTIEYYHVKKRTWNQFFSLGEGDYSEVDLVRLKATRQNKDFRPMRYSNCKWVLW